MGCKIIRVLERAALWERRSERRSFLRSGERSAARKMKLRAGAGAPLFYIRERWKERRSHLFQWPRNCYYLAKLWICRKAFQKSFSSMQKLIFSQTMYWVIKTLSKNCCLHFTAYREKIAFIFWMAEFLGAVKRAGALSRPERERERRSQKN